MKYEISGNIVFRGITYERDELVQRMQKMIYNFIHMDIFNEQVVGLFFERSPDMILCIFALLNLSKCFLPIDQNLPVDRIEKMLKKAKVKKVLCDKNKLKINSADFLIFNRPQSHLNTINHNNNVAYILFTSGTTGIPKGVEVCYKGLDNFLTGIPEVVPLKKGQKIISFTNYTFDIFFLESVLALTLGLDMVLASENETNNPRGMKRLLLNTKADVLQITPSRLMFLNVVDPQFTSLKNIKLLLVGGERISKELFEMLKRYTKARIFNMYGPTETTIWSTVSEITNKENIDIGAPIANTRIYLVNPKDKSVVYEKDKVAEICIAGDGLAKGYINDEDMTNRNFGNMLCKPYERVYHTGDLGKYLENGQLVCLGRLDEQIKIRGHRVELGDIDANIINYSNIQNAVSCYWEEREKIIVFYQTNFEINVAHLRKKLRNFIPDYMIPEIWCKVEEIPLSSNGKIQRKKILEMWQERQSVQDVIIKILKKYSSVEHIRHDTLLEEINLNSIDFIQVLLELETYYGIEFKDDFLLANSYKDILDIASYIIQKVSE